MAKTDPCPELLPGVLVRPYLPSDAEAVSLVAEATRALDPGVPLLDLARWRYVCADPYADPEVTFRVAEEADGRLVGFSYRFDPPRPEGGSYRAVFVIVHPDHRRRGIGRALFHASAGDPVDPAEDPGWVLTSTVEDCSTAGWLFARRLGFRKDRVHLVLARELPGRPLPEPDCPAAIERFTGTHAYEDWATLHNAAFAGEPGAIRHDPVELERTRPEDFRPGNVRFAKMGGRRVGYLYLRESTAGGYIESLGVLPEARGKGVGTALLLSALEYLQERGHRRVELTVHEENRPALKLYARLGFEESSRRVWVVRGSRPARRRKKGDEAADAA